MRFLKKFLELLGGVGGIPLKYGPQRGFVGATCAVQMVASTVLKDNSGKFVTLDASGYAALTSSGSSASCFGWVHGEAQTTSATAGGTTLGCSVFTDTIYRIPVNNAYTAGGTNALWLAILGKKLDLQLDSNVQGLNADHATVGHVTVIAQDPWVSAPSASGAAAITTTTGCRWVDVILNQAIQAK